MSHSLHHFWVAWFGCRGFADLGISLLGKVCGSESGVDCSSRHPRQRGRREDSYMPPTLPQRARISSHKAIAALVRNGVAQGPGGGLSRTSVCLLCRQPFTQLGTCTVQPCAVSIPFIGTIPDAAGVMFVLCQKLARPATAEDLREGTLCLPSS